MLAIIGEDTTHAMLVEGLTRRTLHKAALDAHVTWLIDALPTSIEWSGDEDLGAVRAGLRYTPHVRAAGDGTRLGVRVEIDGRTIKLRGFIGARSLAPEADHWRRALVAVLSREGVEVVIAARDTDGDPSRLEGLRQAASLFRRPIIICAPHQDARLALIATRLPRRGRASAGRGCLRSRRRRGR